MSSLSRVAPLSGLIMVSLGRGWAPRKNSDGSSLGYVEEGDEGTGISLGNLEGLGDDE